MLDWMSNFKDLLGLFNVYMYIYGYIYTYTYICMKQLTFYLALKCVMQHRSYYFDCMYTVGVRGTDESLPWGGVPDPILCLWIAFSTTVNPLLPGTWQELNVSSIYLSLTGVKHSFPILKLVKYITCWVVLFSLSFCSILIFKSFILVDASVSPLYMANCLDGPGRDRILKILAWIFMLQ